jgi:hypothetical protein
MLNALRTLIGIGLVSGGLLITVGLLLPNPGMSGLRKTWDALKATVTAPSTPTPLLLPSAGPTRQSSQLNTSLTEKTAQDDATVVCASVPRSEKASISIPTNVAVKISFSFTRKRLPRSPRVSYAINNRHAKLSLSRPP